MEIKFDTETIRIITLIENMCGIKVKDCLNDKDFIYVVVEEGYAAKAIGKNGTIVKNFEKIFNKNVKIFEYSADPLKFVKNLIPYATSIYFKDGKINVKIEKIDRPKVIGKEGKKLKIYKSLLKRSFGIDMEVK